MAGPLRDRDIGRDSYKRLFELDWITSLHESFYDNGQLFIGCDEAGKKMNLVNSKFTTRRIANMNTNLQIGTDSILQWLDCIRNN